MKVQELRIGNYVTASVFGGKDVQEWVHVIGKVDAIQSHTHIKVGDGVVWDIDSISGIPFTEEWLPQFGFEESGFVAGDRDYEVDIYTLGDLVCSFASFGDKSFRYKGLELNFPEYVHQLQNLFHALTGEELTSTV
jgi:hypothetical protein